MDDSPAPAGAIEYRCEACGDIQAAVALHWRCPVCGGALVIHPDVTFELCRADPEVGGVWRFRAALPAIPGDDRITLGEAATPLIALERQGGSVLVKLEQLQPTGSYKDRGAAVLVSVLRALGVARLREDSSGNAAASIAAYASAGGIGCEIFAPSATSPAKLAQAAAHGASMRLVDGGRPDAEAAGQSPQAGSAYAGHNWHPAFLAGVSTLGYELAEQLGARVPGSVVVPLGYGNLLLGLWEAFSALRRADPALRMPRLYGVQAEAFSPVAAAWRAGASSVTPARPGETVAEGIRCTKPVRDRRVLAAVRDSGGAVVSVGEPAIASALSDLLARGFYVEPTSAVAWAGLDLLPADADARVVVLTGSGLKAPGAVQDAVAAARATQHGQAGEPDHDARHGAER
jgi:threonine synthase